MLPMILNVVVMTGGTTNASKILNIVVMTGGATNAL